MEVFGNDLDLCEYGHEVGITIPPRYKVYMQVVRDSGTGCRSHVRPYVDAMRLELALKDCCRPLDCVHQCCRALCRQLGQVTFMVDRCHQEVPRIVWETVQKHNNLRRLSNDQVVE